MHWLFFTLRFFPYWALPLVLVLWETGVYYKRRNIGRGKLICWGVDFLLIVAICSWFFFRGDVHSDDWVKSFLNNFQ